MMEVSLIAIFIPLTVLSTICTWCVDDAEIYYVFHNFYGPERAKRVNGWFMFFCACLLVCASTLITCAI